MVLSRKREEFIRLDLEEKMRLKVPYLKILDKNKPTCETGVYEESMYLNLFLEMKLFNHKSDSFTCSNRPARSRPLTP